MLEAWISDSNVLHCITAQENTSDQNIVDVFLNSFIQFQETMIIEHLYYCFQQYVRRFFTFLSKNKNISKLASKLVYWIFGRYALGMHLLIEDMCFGLGLMGWNEKGYFYPLRLQY